MKLSTKQKLTHRHREQTCDCWGGVLQGRDGLGVWSLGLVDENCYIYVMDKQQDPMYSTGNYIQYPVISHGKQY